MLSTKELMLLNCSAGEDSWESLDCKEFKLVHPKGNQPWIFTERTDAEAEAPILWVPDAKDWVTGKDPNAGKDWRQEQKAVAVDEIDGITNSKHMDLSKLWEILEDGRLECWVHRVQLVTGHDLVTEQQQSLHIPFV